MKIIVRNQIKARIIQLTESIESYKAGEIIPGRKYAAKLDSLEKLLTVNKQLLMFLDQTEETYH